VIKLLKDFPQYKESYDAADEEEQIEILAELRRKEMYKRNLRSALDRLDSGHKKVYEELSEERQRAAGAALVARRRLQRGLASYRKESLGPSGLRGVCVKNKKYLAAQISFEGKMLHLGYFDTVRATPPCPPLRPAHCIPLSCKTALRLRTELYSCGGGKCTTQAEEAARAYDSASRLLGRPEELCNYSPDP